VIAGEGYLPSPGSETAFVYGGGNAAKPASQPHPAATIEPLIRMQQEELHKQNQHLQEALDQMKSSLTQLVEQKTANLQPNAQEQEALIGQAVERAMQRRAVAYAPAIDPLERLVQEARPVRPMAEVIDTPQPPQLPQQGSIG